MCEYALERHRMRLLKNTHLLHANCSKQSVNGQCSINTGWATARWVNESSNNNKQCLLTAKYYTPFIGKFQTALLELSNSSLVLIYSWHSRRIRSSILKSPSYCKRLSLAFMQHFYYVESNSHTSTPTIHTSIKIS